MMGDRPVKLNDEALRVIKVRVDRYATRQNSASLKPGEESLRSTYARAPEYIPVIARAFAAREDSDCHRRISADDRICIHSHVTKMKSERKVCFSSCRQTAEHIWCLTR